MRRSPTIRLTLLACLALQACGSEDVDAVDVVIPDMAACLERFGAEARAECDRSMAEGQAEHARTAPRFATVAACREATGGECVETPATLPADRALAPPGIGQVAIPIMAGLLVGRMLNNATGRVTTPLHAGRPPPQCQPGMLPESCVTRTSGSTSSGSRFYYSGASYAGSAAEGRGARAFNASPAMAASIATPRAGAASIARGGFGASARGFSGSS